MASATEARVLDSHFDSAVPSTGNMGRPASRRSVHSRTNASVSSFSYRRKAPNHSGPYRAISRMPRRITRSARPSSWHRSSNRNAS